MSHVLIVDDEVNIRRMIRKYAEFYEHEVSEAANGIEAVELCRENSYDAVIMDIMMPELDGFSAAAEILKNKAIPILMLSARGEEYDKIHGFELGIEDYVVKPFSPRELMLRLNVLISRNKRMRLEQQKQGNETGLLIDFAAHRVSIDGQPIDLTPKACELLLYLARNSGIALTRDKLITEVWGYDFDGDDRTLDAHIKMIRNNLDSYRECISTLRGLGYRFDRGDGVTIREMRQ